MIYEPRVLSSDLQLGLRGLDVIDSIELLQDWRWYPVAEKWVLQVALSLPPSDSNVPLRTAWYVLVDEAYPEGSIRFHPALNGGISGTFHHQMHNGMDVSEVPWRRGHLCLETQGQLLTRDAGSPEPHDAERRLLWHIRRAVSWLHCAAAGSLALPGDPFELPHFPTSGDAVVAVAEDAASFGLWRDQKRRWGQLRLRVVREAPTVYVTTEFLDHHGNSIRCIGWGDGVSGSETTGAWILLHECPAKPPWEAVSTWGDLLANGDTANLVRQVCGILRDGQEHLLLVGFPIPLEVGGDHCRIHFQALFLPPLTSTQVPGFPATEKGYWARDCHRGLRPNARLRWQASENWAEDVIRSRANLTASWADMKLVVIGAGALGATFAEMVVRGGCKAMSVIDPDRLEIGNLVRHTLDLEDLKSAKASALARRLNSCSPYARVDAYVGKFPDIDDDASDVIRKADLIVECTGEDSVLRALQDFPWQPGQIVSSLSLGYAAERLYCYVANGSDFRADSFGQQFRPWWDEEITTHPPSEYPREGIGCWHPVFPASGADVSMMAAIAVRHLAQVIMVDDGGPDGLLVVYQQIVEDGLLQGVRRADTPGDTHYAA